MNSPVRFFTFHALANKTFHAPTLMALSLAAALLSPGARGQTVDPASVAAVAPAAKASQPASSPAPVPAAAPKHSEKDLHQAFSFMDKNGDGKISREEASGFRGVAKHFDEADTDKDNALSFKEFERAMNGPKP
ncbi:MAG: EF-hand domain-containing protein [Polaromonas sp.]